MPMFYNQLWIKCVRACVLNDGFMTWFLLDSLNQNCVETALYVSVKVFEQYPCIIIHNRHKFVVKCENIKL